jgi:squalene-hopene/tetraprenyl-beta-curcumene cyclase
VKFATFSAAAFAGLFGVGVMLGGAADPPKLPPPAREVQDKARALQAKGVEFLLKTQRDNGQWGEDPSNPAVTGLVLRALLGSGQVDATHPVVVKGLKYVLGFVKPDGGVYRDTLQNYNTSICLMAVHAAGRAEHKPVVAAAQAFLIKGQYGASEHVDELNPNNKKHAWYGGNGYGEAKYKGRPDLSNTHMMLEALRETGITKDHEAFKRAVSFLSRLQLRSESNDQPWARDVGDEGGFIYEIGGSKAPDAVGASGAKTLRSYGSMTYAGFKSMLYAGLARDDPRVRSAFEWIRRNYSVTQNPYMDQEGLFYYYHTFAKALRAWGEADVKDRGSVPHPWRDELIDVLAARQKSDGSWINDKAKRWLESDPFLVTAYALLAVEECLK